MSIAIPLIGLSGLTVAIYTYFSIKRLPPGNEAMVEISDMIHDGAMTFLRREYTMIAFVMAAIFAALSIFVSPGTAWAFLGGAACSMLAGFIGMKAATRAAVRATQAAKTDGISGAFYVAFSGGSVMGLTVSSLGVMGLAALTHFTTDSTIINGFAMGASTIALFARVGGGIYTKAADIGADIVGKTEAGIPEDDIRNPGVIADNVGDCVGDTAGMGADLFESYVGSVIAALAIAATYTDGSTAARMMLPLALVAAGLVASIIGVLSMNIFKNFEPQNALRYTTMTAGVLFLAAGYVLTKNIMSGDLAPFWAVAIGLATGMIIGAITEWYTSGPPVRALAETAESGAATTIISGIAIGYESCALPLLTIVLGMYGAYTYGGGIYGIAMAAVGMLSTLGVVLSTDAYGPIADNAGGIAEMSHAGPEIRKITDKLDALGNTTAAIGKGFAIGSAALTALALFSAFQKTAGLAAIDLTKLNTVIGLLLGGLVPCIIAAMTLKSVGKAANDMVKEIRRQFKEIPGLLEGKAKADPMRCIEIVTDGALRQMILPGVVAVLSPLIVAALLGLEALGGFLASATTMGVLTGMMMSNAGAVWDNAKKTIEAGAHGGKGSPAHTAAVIGDTVGDPFKDTTGPSMNILVKLMTIVSLVFAPAFM